MLKSNILKQLPDCRIVLPKPLIRLDHGKVNLTIRNVNKHLSLLQLKPTKNDNIGAQQLE